MSAERTHARWGITVPGNRWDLVPAPVTPPRVSVIIPFFEQHAELARVLAGLGTQRGFVEMCDVIVVDDGSHTPPSLPDELVMANGRSVAIQLAVQEDRGCRPAAARNLGATLARGDVFVFFDGDTVPAPDAVARLAALPAVAGEVVTVGRREYAELDTWDASTLAEWLSGDGATSGPTPSGRPAWLDDAYTASADLLQIDNRSYQLVIGAVMATSRAMFEEVGGFDASIDCYGGEDWDIAYRAYCAGALLAHIPAAIGWHHGPDWRGREGDDATKNPERMALVERVPGPSDPIIGPFVQIVVRVCLPETTPDDQVLATIAALLRAGGTSIVVYLERPSAAVAGACRHDQRVRTLLAADVNARSLVQIDVTAPSICEPGAIGDVVDRVSPNGAGRVVVVDDGGVVWRVTATRALARARRWASPDGVDATLEDLFGLAVVSSTEVGVSRLAATTNLDDVFPR